jgi:hypothetical protein
MNCIYFVTSMLFILSALASSPLPASGSGSGTESKCESYTPSPLATVVASRPEVTICSKDQVAWVTVTRSADNDVSVNESRHFAIDLSKVGYGLGVDEIASDSPSRFHIQFTYGRASTPTSDIFRFTLKNGKWYVSGRDYRTTTRCTDGSIDSGSSYSINYFTGSAIVDIFDQCKLYKEERISVKARHITLAQFDLFNPLLDVEEF